MPMPNSDDDVGACIWVLTCAYNSKMAERLAGTSTGLIGGGDILSQPLICECSFAFGNTSSVHGLRPSARRDRRKQSPRR